MTEIWAKQALTRQGWAESVLVSVDESGAISSVESSVPARGERVSILLPAPANLHSHAFQRAIAGLTESRSSAEGDDFWTWRQAMYRLLQHLDPDDVEGIAAYAQLEMLEAGFSAVAEFHYLHHTSRGWPYDNPGEMSARLASAADATGIGLTLLPTLYVHGSMDGRELEGAQLRFGSHLVGFADIVDAASTATASLASDCTTGVALHSMRTVPLDQIAGFRDNFPSMPIHIHAAEQVAEVDLVLQVTSQRPVEWLLEHAGAGEGWSIIHATHMSHAETRDLARSGAVAGLCPITESNLGDGIFNGRSYVGQGGNYGVGTDSNVRISLAKELETLEYSQRLRHRARAALANAYASPARDLYESAALGGALACGRNSGEIAVGALADLVELDGDSIELSGLANDMILDAWTFAAPRNPVRNLWSAGRHVVRNGRHFRREAIECRYAEIQRRLRSLI